MIIEAIDSTLFSALQNIDIHDFVDRDISLVLPYMANLLMSSSFVKRPQLLRILYPIKKMNDLIQVMSIKCIDQIDPRFLETTSFESSNYTDKLRVVAAEYNRLHELTRQANLPGANQQQSTQLIQSDLFDSISYIEDVSYCLCTILMKSTVYNILDMSETLLHVKYGYIYIVRLVANLPERCLEVCHSLISMGDRLDETSTPNELSEKRAKTLRLLCQINPSIANTARSSTLHLCKLPSLTVMITSDQLGNYLNRYNAGEEPAEKVLTELGDCFDGVIAFMTGIFLDCEESTRVWFAQYTKNVQLKRIDHNQFSVFSNLRTQLTETINILFKDILGDGEECTNAQALNRSLIRCTATLRLYCCFRGIGSIKLNSDEVELLLRLINFKSSIVNRTVVNYAITGVCTLLVCSALISNQKDEKRAADWLKWILKESNYSDTRHSSKGKCSISELLLLVAIHFLNNQTSQIADLVCATLGMKLQIKISVPKCKTLFVQEVFNDQMVTEHAVKVPVTKNLSNNITEFLPAHCIHQLLESRSFSKHQVPINHWIYKQICESKRPIHNIMPKLVESYVNSVINFTMSANGQDAASEPISEEQLISIFKHQLYTDHNIQDNDNIVKMDTCEEEPHIVDIEAAQVLLLYYILLYEDLRLKKNPDFNATERARLTRYSPDFMMEIPVFYLLKRVRSDQDSFGTVFPELIKLVTSQFPQLCSIQHWMSIEHFDIEDSSANKTNRNNNNNIGDYIITSDMLVSHGQIQNNHKLSKDIKQNLQKQLFDHYNSQALDLTLLTRDVNQILLLDREDIWPFAQPFIENLPKLLSLDSDDQNSIDYKKLINASTKLWWRLNNIFPRKLWVMTVNALKRPQECLLDLKAPEHTWDELVLDPLIVLRCDLRVFRCSNLLNITLNILNAFLAASRRCLQDHIYEQPRQVDLRSLEELRSALMHAQTSAAIQILLEYCLPLDIEQECLIRQENGIQLSFDEEQILSRFETSVNCVCEHLHQVFISDTNLAKLVHFQTYQSELLSTTSDKIPSMHICLDFIPELLSQPDISKQVFVIELTSHLCEKYAITKSLNVAKLCFNVAFTMLQLLSSERRALFFIPVLPALIRMCDVFPILRDDAEIILNQINQISVAHMASTSSRLSLGAARPFEGLDKLSWREAKKLMSTLNLNEALYLCIQKSLTQLKKNNDIIDNNIYNNNSMNNNDHGKLNNGSDRFTSVTM